MLPHCFVLSGIDSMTMMCFQSSSVLLESSVFNVCVILFVCLNSGELSEFPLLILAFGSAFAGASIDAYPCFVLGLFQFISLPLLIGMQ